MPDPNEQQQQETEQSLGKIAYVPEKELPKNREDLWQKMSDIRKRMNWKIEHSNLSAEEKKQRHDQIDQKIKEFYEQEKTFLDTQAYAQANNYPIIESRETFKQNYIAKLDEMAALVPDQDAHIFNEWLGLHNTVWDEKNLGRLGADLYSREQAQKVDDYLRQHLGADFENAPDEQKIAYLKYMKETFEKNLDIARNADDVHWHTIRDRDIAYMLDEKQTEADEKTYEKEHRLHKGKDFLQYIETFEGWKKLQRAEAEQKAQDELTAFKNNPTEQDIIRRAHDALDKEIKDFRKAGGRSDSIRDTYFDTFFSGWNTGPNAVGLKKSGEFTPEDKTYIENALAAFENQARTFAGDVLTKEEAYFQAIADPKETLPEPVIAEAKREITAKIDEAKGKLPTERDVNQLATLVRTIDSYIAWYEAALAHYDSLFYLQKRIDALKAKGEKEDVLKPLNDERSRITNQIPQEVTDANTDLTDTIDILRVDVTLAELKNPVLQGREPTAKDLIDPLQKFREKVKTPGYDFGSFYMDYASAGKKKIDGVEAREELRDKLNEKIAVLGDFAKRDVRNSEVQRLLGVAAVLQGAIEAAAKNGLDVDNEAGMIQKVDTFMGDEEALEHLVTIDDWLAHFDKIDTTTLSASSVDELQKLKAELIKGRSEIEAETSGHHTDRATEMDDWKRRADAFAGVKLKGEISPETPIPPIKQPETTGTKKPKEPEPPPEPSKEPVRSRSSAGERVREALTKDKLTGKFEQWTLILQNLLREKLGPDTFKKRHEWAAILALRGKQVTINRDGKPIETIAIGKDENVFSAMEHIGNRMQPGDILTLPIDDIAREITSAWQPERTDQITQKVVIWWEGLESEGRKAAIEKLKTMPILGELVTAMEKLEEKKPETKQEALAALKQFWQEAKGIIQKGEQPGAEQGVLNELRTTPPFDEIMRDIEPMLKSQEDTQKNRVDVARMWHEYTGEKAPAEKEKTLEPKKEPESPRPEMNNRELWGLLTEGGTASTRVEAEFLNRYNLGTLAKPREELEQGPSKTPTVRLSLDWGTVDIRLQENGRLAATMFDKNGKQIPGFFYIDTRSETPEKFAEVVKAARAKVISEKKEEKPEDIFTFWDANFKDKDSLEKFSAKESLGTVEAFAQRDLVPGQHNSIVATFDWAKVAIVLNAEGRLAFNIVAKDDATFAKSLAAKSRLQNKDELLTELKKVKQQIQAS